VTGLLAKIATRFIKGRWGSILPAILRAAAEGQLGEPVKRAYWVAAGYRTFTGAVLVGLGAALETVCGSYPDMAWACPAARYVYIAGGLLAAVGLVDGGVRAPWPAGTPIAPEDKR
jgi:hypothetical protein